jgi:hypothetical protein
VQRLLILPLVFAAATLVGAPAEPASKPPPHPLVWDAMEKEITPRAGEEAADFVFSVTNKSDRPIEIRDVRPSCTCTTVETPPIPWTLAPGQNGSLRATITFSGKQGRFSRVLFVQSSVGTQLLGLVINLPEAPAPGAK